MPTKFVVLWLKTIFTEDRDSNGNLTELLPNQTMEMDVKTSLEDAWRLYNRLTANDDVQQVTILTPIREFKR